jgi:peptidoglycan/LPS O-acetylase OafA/YrhL
VKARLPQLDGLRGLAILLVLVRHYLVVDAKPAPHTLFSHAVFLLQITWSGVDLFFVLSGFLIGGILVDARASSRYFKPFYARRFFRIVPVYALVCGLYGLAWSAGGQRWWGTAGAWLFGHPPPWYAFVLFVQNVVIAVRGDFAPLPVGVTWSLAVEEQFYLTLPLLVRFVPARRLLPVLAAIVACVPVARTLAYFMLPNGGVVAYTMMPLRADALLLGAIAALLVRDERARGVLVRRRTAVVAATALLGVVLLAFIGLGRATRDSAAMSTVGYTLVALFYAAILLLAVTRPAGALSALLQARWLRGLGEIAYGTYLLHLAVEGICFGVLFGHAPQVTGAKDLGAKCAALALTVLLARASWKLFEKRMVGVGHRFGYDAAPDPPAAPSSWA